MTNRDVARVFNLLGKLKELHGENAFRTRAYSAAYVAIRKLPASVFDMSNDELLAVSGIGKTIVDKINELAEDGELKALRGYLDKTPSGVVELLQIKGLGPSKVRAVWKEMGIETPGELLYACMENRLVELKGFGAKTQKSIRKQIEYFLDSKGKYLYGHIIEEGTVLLQMIREEFPDEQTDFHKEFRRKMPVVEGIEILTTVELSDLTAFLMENEVVEADNELYFNNVRVLLESVRQEIFAPTIFRGSASGEFLETYNERFDNPEFEKEELYFEHFGLAIVPPEAREDPGLILPLGESPDLLKVEDIKGVVHAHSTYSDGSNTLREMIEASIEKGYEYLVISDHSKAAFYANGLTEERVFAQMEEIDALNKEYSEFYIFKSIECDILSDGSLDYGDDFLVNFDLVIASIHSNLKMDIDKANERLMGAIRNPHTRILGHPTGRLLLSREGYPVDHQKIIDACAEHGVVIEINASPYRLDLDWTWIPYAREKGVLLSVNPDAHSIKGIDDIRFGVIAGRKGGLQTSQCLNTKTLMEFTKWVNNA